MKGEMIRQMATKTVCAIAAVVLLSGGSVGAQRPLGPEEFNSIDDLAVAIAAYFPKVAGAVSAVQGDRATVGLGKKDGILPGMVLTIWREGKELLHPVTNAVIGRTEEAIGELEIATVADATATGVLKKRLKDPRPGDRARISPKKIPIAVLALRQERPEVVQALIDRLNESGRFSVLPAEKTALHFKGKLPQDGADLKTFGAAFSLEAVVAVGIYPTEGKSLITARLFYAEDGKPLDTIVGLLATATKRDALGDVRPYFAPAPAAAQITPDLPVDARLFATADFDGDGKPEYAFSDERRVHLYRLAGTEWREIWTEALTPAIAERKQFYLDAADMNGNGRAELYCTAMLNGSVVTSVLELQDRAVRSIAEQPGFLRVIRVPGGGPALIGQNYDPRTFFAGALRRFEWAKGVLTAGAAFDIPRSLDFYGFQYAEFGEAKPLLVGFDDEDRLIVYAGDSPVWKSEERYPAASLFVHKPPTGAEAALGKSGAEQDKTLRVRIHGRLFAFDMDGSGRDRLMVVKNTATGFQGDYKDGQVHSLAWTGARLDERWSIKDLPGPVLDAQVQKGEEGANRIVALLRQQGGLFSKDRVRLYLYPVK